MIKALKADLLERSCEQSPDLDDRLRLDAFAPVERAGRTAQAFEVWRQRLPGAGGGGLGAGLRLRPLPGGQRPDRRDLPGRDTADRRRQAEDAHAGVLPQAHPHDTDRDYLLDVFRRVGKIPAAQDLFAEGKTPLWAVGPTGDGAAGLLDVLAGDRPRDRGAWSGRSRVEGGDTRFLGDLYQDLSEAARKKYALLQTPVFVEEFILDRTLTPAIDEFGLEAVRLIDPTCGSGHFLLGAFGRLFDAVERARARRPSRPSLAAAGARRRVTAWTSTRSRSRSRGSG